AVFYWFGTGLYLAIDIKFAYAPGYQLRVLRTKVKNKYLFVHVYYNKLSLPCSAAKVKRYVYLLLLLYYTILCFKTFYIFYKGVHQPFGVLRCHYHPCLYFGLGYIRHYIHKVKHKFCKRVCNDDKVRIYTIRHFFG